MERVDQAATNEQDFGEIFARDYYRADSYAVDRAVSKRSFHLAKAQAGLVPVARFSGYALGVRRTWKHIRQGPSNLYVIWFPLEGSVSVTQDEAHGEVVSNQQMVITCGDRPFHIKALTDQGQSRCSQIHVLVPKHLMRTHLPEIDRLCGKPYAAESGEAIVVRELFSTLIREAQTMDERSAAKLGSAALETLIGYIRSCSGTELDKGPQHAQLERILSFVRQHISTQGLTVDHVAKGCNMSRRYVHYLMKHHNKSFSQFLWECRLEQADQWLSDRTFAHFNIVDIAYMAGFRSASHFSQAYRTRYGVSPKEARKRSEPALN